MSNTVIRVENIGKLYRIGSYDPYRTLADAIYALFAHSARRIRNGFRYKEKEREYIWALKEVSFEVKQGEILGIVGRNGSGKSTLLKILSRITVPTDGFAHVQGRIASLLEIGIGFHPDLTGRENIYLNGAIMGMRKFEIKGRFDEIVSFAGVDKFVDVPVKYYSSGMYVRLAFAVAAHLESDILLIDEVLAVGDLEFQKKCLGKMDDATKQGRTILFISHNMAAINRLCGRALWIDKGRIMAHGVTADVLEKYISFGSEHCGARYWPQGSEGKDAEIALRSVCVCREGNEVSDIISILTPFSIKIEYEIKKEVPPMRIILSLIASDGTIVFISRDNYHTQWSDKHRPPGRYVSTCYMPAELLNAGHYSVTVAAELPFIKTYFRQEYVLRFCIQRTGGVGAEYTESWPGVICPALKWETSCV